MEPVTETNEQHVRRRRIEDHMRLWGLGELHSNFLSVAELGAMLDKLKQRKDEAYERYSWARHEYAQALADVQNRLEVEQQKIAAEPRLEHLEIDPLLRPIVYHSYLGELYHRAEMCGGGVNPQRAIATCDVDSLDPYHVETGTEDA